MKDKRNKHKNKFKTHIFPRCSKQQVFYLSLSLFLSLCFFPFLQQKKKRKEILLISVQTALFSQKKTSRPFKDFYADWMKTLKNNLLPRHRESISLASSSPIHLCDTVDMIHNHFQIYYNVLELAASDNVAQLLYPDWRNSLEKPFMWLGDFHPYLFTNLLRSFLEDGDDEEDDDDDKDVAIADALRLFDDKPWNIVMAWKSPGKTLMARVDQIECGLRLMVPALVARARDAQVGLVERVAAGWVGSEGRKEGVKTAIEEAMKVKMDEMTCVFVDANRLRRSVLADIMAALNVYQASLFFEGLAQFFVGFWDHELLNEFDRCKLPIDW